MTLAQIDPKYVQHAADNVGAAAKDNPLWVVVIALGAIVAVMLLGVVWWIRKGHPDTMAARAAALKDSADRAEADRKARAEEKTADRQLLKEVALASITQAQDGARAAVSEITHEIGERVQDVQQLVSQANESTRRTERNVAAMAAKMGIGIAIFALVAFAPSSAGPQGSPDLGAPAQELAALRPEPGPSPDVCNPRCPVGQSCSGRICTIMVRPKQPRPAKPRPVRKVTGGEPKPEPAPMPVSDNYAVLTRSWTDGRDPFDREPENMP